MLSILGPRVNALRVPLLGRLTAPRVEAANAAPARLLASLGARRHAPPRAIVLLASCAILVALGWPIFSMQVSHPWRRLAAQERRGAPGREHPQRSSSPAEDANPVYVVVTAPDGSSMLTGDNLAKVDNLTTWLAAAVARHRRRQPDDPPQRERLAHADRAAADRALHLRRLPAESRAGASSSPRTTAGDTTLITLNSNTQLDSDAGKALIDAILRSGR